MLLIIRDYIDAQLILYLQTALELNDLAIMDLNDSIAYEITRTGNILRKLIQRRLKAVGVDLSPEESVLMNQLWDHGEMTIAALRSWSVKEPSTISRQIDSLVRKGYVERRESVTDRRHQIISVSAKGAGIREKVLRAELHLVDEEFVALEPRSRKMMLETIGKIRQAALAELGEKP